MAKIIIEIDDELKKKFQIKNYEEKKDAKRSVNSTYRRLCERVNIS